MSEILLVNPRRRATGGRGRKKTRSPAQKAATRRLVARNKKGGSTSRKRKRNPVPGRRSASRTRRTTRRATRRKSNPSLGINRRTVMDSATAAASGAAGAIALDIALAYLPLPIALKSGVMGKVTKAVGAIALGVAAKATKLVSNATARDMTVGALTVQFTGIGRDLLGQFAPGVALSAYADEDYMDALGYAGSGWNPSQSLNWANNGMGAYNVGEGYDIAAPGDGQPGLNEYESEQAFGW